MKYLLSNCRDFEEEESMLQTMGRKMGILVDRTPKCHCELAGEGIEYSWGCSKNAYRLLPLSEKRKKETFLNGVRKCLSREVLTTERVRKNARRAREYICAYHTFHISEKQSCSNESESGEVEAQGGTNSGTGSEHGTASSNTAKKITPNLIEKMAKNFKTHRCALDFDRGFINHTMVKSANFDDG